mmetsp:Transcript_59529/g.153296  ORF Transcript_59529/g.153296 Transcript_59529/m.153296 type:complete len:465 (-) Transcript_59529:586-1980(-)
MYATNFMAMPVQHLNAVQGMQPVLVQCANDGSPFVGCPIMWSADATQMQASGAFVGQVEVFYSQEDLTILSGEAEKTRRSRRRRRGRRCAGNGMASPAEGGQEQPGDMVAAAQWDGSCHPPPTKSYADAVVEGLSSVPTDNLDDTKTQEPSSTRESSVHSNDESNTPQRPKEGSLEELVEHQEKCSELVAKLEAADSAEKKRIIEWLLPVAMQLALSRCGCRVVQKALEAQGSAGRNLLVAELEPNTVELYESLHGNHVLTKMIEMMPSAALRPIVDRLWEKGATSVARHRFGCRVFERLIEHCNETEIGALLDQIVADSEALCRHQYGNFVVQHLLEHGSALRRNAILARLLPDIPALAMHRTASHVVQRALDYSDEEGQAAIVNQLLWAANPGSLIEVAGSRYGSFVAEQLNTLKMPNNQGLSDEVARRFADNIAELGKSNFGNRVVECFGLEVPPTPGVEN